MEVHGWDSGLKLGQVHAAFEKSEQCWRNCIVYNIYDYIYNASRCRQLMWTRMTTRWFSTVAPLSGTGSRSTQRIDSLHEKRNLFRWRLVLTVLVLSAIYLPGWHNPDVRCKQRKSDLQLWKGHFLHASWPRKYLGVIIWNNIFQITLFTGAFKFLIITLPCLEHRYGGQHMGHRCRSSSGKDEPKQKRQ